MQWVRDPALSLQWLGRQLWHEFDPWPGNFYMPQVWPKKKKKIDFVKLLNDFVFFLSFFFFFFLFRVPPTAYGTRGLIGAVAASLHQSHINTRSELCL